MLIQLKGQITEQGELRVKLPAGMPAGEVDVFVLHDTISDDEQWTEAELAALFSPQAPAASGAEIVAWLAKTGTTGWEDITDSAAWVEEQRLKQRRQLPSW
jgi:hypothetical protein